LARLGAWSGPRGGVDVAEHVLPVADDGVLQAARVLVHEPVRVRTALLVPQLPHLADLHLLAVHDVRHALRVPRSCAGGARGPAGLPRLVRLLELAVGEEEAVPGSGQRAELAGELAGLAGVDVGVVDEGADGFVQRRAGEELRQVVGGGLERRRVEAEAAGEDLRAQRRHVDRRDETAARKGQGEEMDGIDGARKGRNSLIYR
jgi:hypothetical protein